MRARRVPLPLAALLLTAVLLTSLAATPSRASADQHEGGSAGPAGEAGSGYVTTLLHPGWNMAGWLGAEAPVSELFSQVPGLEHVYAWDPAGGRYRRALPNSTPRFGLREVGPGMGLFLYLGGDSPVEWSRSAPESPVLLSLSAGRNLVGWAGGDGEPFAAAAARFGDALVVAERWNAGTGRWDRYRPGAGDSANTLRELGTGDALWVELASGVRWWQSGLAGTEFLYLGELGEEQRLSLRDEVAAVVTFFAERYGIEPPQFTVEYHPNLEIFAGALPGRIFLSREVMDYPLRDVTLAHEYFHILQRDLGTGRRSPAWMTEGTATYAGGLYRLATRGITAEQLRHARWRHTRDVTDALGELELIRLFYPGEAPVYSLAAMAAEWLEGRVVLEGEDFAPEEVGWPDSFTESGAYIEYYRLLGAAEEWEEAFWEAYGIAADDFYDLFESYRSSLYSAPEATVP